MGNPPAGHLPPIERAKEVGGPMVASIFVNRLQFAPHEDFETYPRTFEHDRNLLLAQSFLVLRANPGCCKRVRSCC